MGKKKKWNPLDESLKLGTIGAGTVIAGSMPSMIGKNLPAGGGTTLTKVNVTMGKTLPLIPTIYGAKTVFGGLGSLEEVHKRAKKKKRY